MPRRSPSTRPRAALATVAVAGLATLGLGGLPAGAVVDDDGNVVIDIVGINDFHGRISEVDDPIGDPAAPRRAAQLASAVQDVRAANPDTVFVAAGDSVGGTTFVSMINDDIPTLEVLNTIGLDASALGNHEFDRGREWLQERIDAGDVQFPYLGANVEVPEGEPEFADYYLHTLDPDGGGPVGEVTVGFVGILTEDMPSLVAAGGIEGMEFTDMTEAALRVADDLTDGDDANGEADIVVVLAHEGATNAAGVTDTSTAFGAFVDALAENGNVDAVFSGHSHQGYAVDVDGMPVVQTPGLGSELARVTLTFDPEEGGVVDAEMDAIGLADYGMRTDDPVVDEVTAIVQAAEVRAEELGAEVVGAVDRDLNRARQSNGDENRGGESTIGNLIADAQLWAAQNQLPDNPPVVAFMNPGGIRADIVAGEDGTVTYRDVATTQPFGNTLVAMDLTGADIVQVLEEQWQPADASRPFLKLGVSDTLYYFYDPQGEPGERVTDVFIEGEEIDPAATYRVVTNSFLATGTGDNFFAFGAGTAKADTGLIDLAALVDYFAANEQVVAPLDQRAIGVHWNTDQTATLAPGDEISVDLSSLSFSTDEPKPEQLAITLVDPETEETIDLGTAAVDNSIVDLTDEVGRAQVRVTVPEIEGLGSTAERWRLEIEDEVTGVLWFDVFLAAQEEPTPTPTEEPTPTPTEAPTTPAPTPTGGGSLPSTGAETNGPLLAGAALVALGSLLVAAVRRRKVG